MDGIIVVNKEKGCTSHDLVSKVKKIVKEKVGHTGTLDPLATGVLPLLIGKGTLCSKYLINHNKEYIAVLKLGVSTDTIDGEGIVLEEKDVDTSILEKANVEKKLYEYARKGESIEIPKREIEIYDMELRGINKIENEIEFKVKCSKGTYIRSLCSDLAKKLGTIGYMKDLKRLKVGEFSIENSITINEKTTKEDIEKKIITIEKLFENKEKIELDTKKLILFLNGVRLNCNNKDEVYRIYSSNKFIGLGTIKNNILKRDIII